MNASHISAIPALPIKDFNFLLLRYLTFMLTWLAINRYNQSLLHLQPGGYIFQGLTTYYVEAIPTLQSPHSQRM